MQGNCSSDDVGDLSTLDLNMAAWSLGKCLIVTDFRLMKVEQNLWIDNLYIRSRDTTSTSPKDTSRVLMTVKETAQVYMTHTVIQGDGVGNMMGMRIHDGGRVYMQGALNLYATTMRIGCYSVHGWAACNPRQVKRALNFLDYHP